MAFAPIALTMPQYEDYPNNWLKAYEQGTTTPLVMATDATGETTVAKFELDAQGFPITAGNARLIPFINGSYDLWLFPTEGEADGNITTNAIQLADNLNADPAISGTLVAFVSTIAALKARSVSGILDGQVVNVSGYYAAGDGGGGEFYWDSSSIVADNGGTVIKVTATTTGRWLRIYNGAINAHWFGAKGDGATDDYASIQAAIDYCETLGIGLEFVGGETYVVSATPTWEGSNISVSSTNGAQFIIAPSTNVPALFVAGQSSTPIATTTLSTDFSVRDGTFSVTSAAGIVVGQLAHLKSDVLWPYDNRGTVTKGELHQVTEISGTTITIAGFGADNYVVSSETVNITFFNPAVAKISDIKVEYPVDTIVSGLSGNYLVDSVFENVSVFNAATAGTGCAYSLNVIFNDCRIHGANQTGTGYGFSIAESSYVTIQNSRITKCRAGVDFTGQIPSRYGMVTGCRINSGGLNTSGTDLNTAGSRALGSHGGVEYTTFSNNEISNVTSGIVVRGAGTTIQENVFIGNMVRCVWLALGHNVRILNNTSIAGPHDDVSTSYQPTHFVDVEYAGAADSENFAKGVIDIIGNSGPVIRGFVALNESSYTALHIHDNRCTLDWGSGNSVSFLIRDTSATGTTSLIGDSSFNNNVATVLSGIYTPVDAAIDMDVPAAIETNMSSINVATGTNLGTLTVDDTVPFLSSAKIKTLTRGQTTGNVGMEVMTNSDSARDAIVFNSGVSGAAGYIRITAAAVAYTSISDYRLKENDTPMIGSIDRVKSLNPINYNFIRDPSVMHDGFLAHEVQAIVPESTGGVKDETDEFGNPVYQGLDQAKLVPLLTSALQEAIARIEALENK